MSLRGSHHIGSHPGELVQLSDSLSWKFTFINTVERSVLILAMS